MNVNDMIGYAENLVEEKYNNQVWYDFVDTVLEELTPLAKVVQEDTVPLSIADNKATISLSSTYLTGLFEVVGVSLHSTGERKKQLRKLAPYDTASLGWIHNDTAVTLINLPTTSANAVVHYYQNLTMTATTSTVTDYTINLPEKYHDIVVKGMCALSMQKEEEGDRKGDFYGEYTMGKRRLLSERIMAVEPWNAQAIMGGGGK